MHTLPVLIFTLNYNNLHEVIGVLKSCLPPLRPGLHFDQFLTKLVGLNCMSIIILWLSSKLNGTIQRSKPLLQLGLPLLCFPDHPLECYPLNDTTRLICIRSHIQAKLSPTSMVVLPIPD